MYILILDLTRGFSGLGKDNCKTRRVTFQFWDLVHLILQVWRYLTNPCRSFSCVGVNGRGRVHIGRFVIMTRHGISNILCNTA